MPLLRLSHLLAQNNHDLHDISVVLNMKQLVQCGEIVIGRTDDPGVPDGTAANEQCIFRDNSCEVWIVHQTPYSILVVLLGGPKI